MMNEALYNAITDFSNKYGCHRFNDEENHQAYIELVDMCVECGKIHTCNRNAFSTHGCLESAIIYVSDRQRFCHSEIWRRCKMKDFDRAIESLGDTVDELFVDDGLETFHYIEDLKLAIFENRKRFERLDCVN